MSDISNDRPGRWGAARGIGRAWVHPWTPETKYFVHDQFLDTEFYNLAKSHLNDPGVVYLHPQDQLDVNGKVMDVSDPGVRKFIGDQQREWLTGPETDPIGRSLQ